MADFDVVVIGAGVSGITAAIMAARAGQKVVLVDAAERIGGCVDTWNAIDDFWLELGAHTAYNSYGAMLALHPDQELFSGLVPRAKVGYHFYEQGRVVSPFSRLGFFEAAAHFPFAVLADKSGKTVEGYFSALLGRGNFKRLLAPAFAAVLSQPAEHYPAEWLFKRKPRNKAAPRKFTHVRGLQGWLEELVTSAGIEVRLNAPVKSVKPEGAGAAVEFESGEILNAAKVVVGAPPKVAGALLSDWIPDLAAQLADTGVAEIETLAVVAPASALSMQPVAGLIGGADAFYSAVSRDYLPHATWRGFAFHFKPGLLDAEGKRQRIAEVLGCKPSDFVRETAKINRLPILTPASVTLAFEIERQLAGLPIKLVGNYLNGLSMGDAAQHAASVIAQ